jgi:hypothetical protein
MIISICYRQGEAKISYAVAFNVQACTCASPRCSIAQPAAAAAGGELQFVNRGPLAA